VHVIQQVGRWDDSPNRHASKHAREVSHPIIKSAELFSIERYEEVIDAYLRGLADARTPTIPSSP
jgi:hypothetical protein